MKCSAFGAGCPGDCATCHMNEAPADITVGELVTLEEDLKNERRRVASLSADLVKLYTELSMLLAAEVVACDQPIPDSMKDEIKDALGM